MGRVVIPEYPHHIVQRGHDRKAVFATECDYHYYLDTLATFKGEYGVEVYAYCLMTNHVHLLLAPCDYKGLGQLMKRLAGRQTRYRNKLERRTGTLWESRYKSSLVDAEEYLLSCVRYIELNPVRAGMVADPGDYPWSSYRARTGVAECPWLDVVPGMEAFTRGNANGASYAAYIRAAIPDGVWELIRTAVSRCQLTGGDRFVEEVREITGHRIETRGQGRPSKSARKYICPVFDEI